LTRQKEATGYRLSLLIGEPAGALNERLKEPKNASAAYGYSTLASPADTIRNRLDVRAAERQLAASTALQGAALAEAFPKISLSTLFGVLDTSLSDPVRIWSYTGGIAAPLLTFGRIEGGIKAADARQQQAFHQYQQAVLQAVADIETQLSNIAQANTRVIKLRQGITKRCRRGKNGTRALQPRYFILYRCPECRAAIAKCGYRSYECGSRSP
jgi:outer membrane protein TolC